MFVAVTSRFEIKFGLIAFVRFEHFIKHALDINLVDKYVYTYDSYTIMLFIKNNKIFPYLYNIKLKKNINLCLFFIS